MCENREHDQAESDRFDHRMRFIARPAPRVDVCHSKPASSHRNPGPKLIQADRSNHLVNDRDETKTGRVIVVAASFVLLAPLRRRFQIRIDAEFHPSLQRRAMNADPWIAPPGTMGTGTFVTSTNPHENMQVLVTKIQIALAGETQHVTRPCRAPNREINTPK